MKMRTNVANVLAVILSGTLLAAPAAAQSLSDDLTGAGGGQSLNLVKIVGKIVIKILPALVGVGLFMMGAARGARTGEWGPAFLTMGAGALLVLAPPLIGYLAGWDLFNYFS